MKKATKKMITLLVCLMLIFSMGAEAFALTIEARAAILMDGQTGEVIFEQNADQALVPGSMAKLMTVYILLDQVKQGNTTLDTPVIVSRATSSLSKNRTYSNVPLQVDQAYTLEQLLASIVTVSACGSTKAVAEYFCGDEATFAQWMNDYAKTLGLQAYFADSSGISSNNRITARSMAVLSQRLIGDFPQILDYTKVPSIDFAGKTYYSTNKMLEGMPQYYWGMDGLKTGYISAAKYCFTGTAKREDVRLISVIMGAENLAVRQSETQKLLDYGFELCHIQLPWKHAQAVPSPSPITVDAQVRPFEMYDIEGSHYVTLRDLATALQQTPKSFNVTWDSARKAILLDTTTSYQPVGGELLGSRGVVADSVAINAKLQLDGQPLRLRGYAIGDTYFFNLRDIAKALKLDITWDEPTQTIVLNTGANPV